MTGARWRRTLAILTVALLAPLLAFGESAADAFVAPENGQCFDSSFQLSFRNLPPAKRIILRAGTDAGDAWVATLNGNVEAFVKTRDAQPEDARWLAIVVPADGSPRFTLRCLPAAGVGVLEYTTIGCYGRPGGGPGSPSNTLTLIGLGETRAHLRSVENGWIADITGATAARIRAGSVRVGIGELTFNAKYDPTDSFYVRVRSGGSVIDTPCEPSVLDVDRLSLQEVAGSAQSVPEDVGVDQPNFFVRTDGEAIVEIVNKQTGDLTVLRISDDFKNPRIEPSGRVLWLRDQEEGEQLRVDLDTNLVTRLPRP